MMVLVSEVPDFWKLPHYHVVYTIYHIPYIIIHNIPDIYHIWGSLSFPARRRSRNWLRLVSFPAWLCPCELRSSFWIVGPYYWVAVKELKPYYLPYIHVMVTEIKFLNSKPY